MFHLDKFFKKGGLPDSQKETAMKLMQAGYTAGERLGGVLSTLIDRAVDSFFAKSDHNE